LNELVAEPTKKELAKLQDSVDPVPVLLIQDQLHLLRSELGVFNGHYEGILRFVGGSVRRPPKILAATATIEAYNVYPFHVC